MGRIVTQVKLSNLGPDPDTRVERTGRHWGRLHHVAEPWREKFGEVEQLRERS
jgi:hypothetical protein